MGENWINDWENILYFLIDRKMLKYQNNSYIFVKDGTIIIPYLLNFEIYFELHGFKSLLAIKETKKLVSSDKQLKKYLDFTQKRLTKVYKNYQ